MYVINITIYLSILSPIRKVTIAIQQEIHNPVKVICRIKEFTWNMVKLVIIFNDTISKEGSYLINYHRLMSGLKINENDKKCCQGFQLKHFKRATLSVWEMLRKGLVTSESHQSWKPLYLY